MYALHHLENRFVSQTNLHLSKHADVEELLKVILLLQDNFTVHVVKYVMHLSGTFTAQRVGTLYVELHCVPKTVGEYNNAWLSHVKKYALLLRRISHVKKQ